MKERQNALVGSVLALLLRGRADRRCLGTVAQGRASPLCFGMLAQGPCYSALFWHFCARAVLVDSVLACLRRSRESALSLLASLRKGRAHLLSFGILAQGLC